MKRIFGVLFLSITAAAQQQYVISTYAGGVSLGLTPAVALNVAIGSPEGIATDMADNVYFTGLNCVFKIDRNGVLMRVAGSGLPGYSGDGGRAVSAQLNSPKALAVDSRNNLYIADSSNYRVRKVDPNGIITTVA